MDNHRLQKNALRADMSKSKISEHPSTDNVEILTAEERVKNELKMYETSPSERVWFAVASLFFLFFFLAVGLPVWWFTTTTYRAALPYSEISELVMRGPPIITVRVRIVCFDHWIEPEQLSAFEIQLLSNLNAANGRSKMPEDSLQLNYVISTAMSTSQESDMLRLSTSLQDFESQLSTERTMEWADGAYYFMLIQNSSQLIEKKGLLRRHGRVIYLRLTESGLKGAQARIEMLLKHVILDVNSLQHSYRANKAAGEKAQRQPVDKKTHWKHGRAFRAASGYDIQLTLLNLQPNTLDARWDMNHATRLFLDPLLARLTRYISLSVRSNYLFYPDLNQVVTRARSDRSAGAILTEEAAARLVSGIESYLALPTAAQPVINIVVVVPHADQVPLRYQPSGVLSEPAASFVFPRWGGFVLLDPPVLATSTNVTNSLNQWQVPAQDYMASILPQIKLLLGLRGDWLRAGNSIVIEAPDHSQLTDWELEMWLRRRAVEQLACALNTLNALVQLTYKVNNMVIRDAVAQQVFAAEAAARLAFQHLEDGGRLREAFATSQMALRAAEGAFFDPTLLELLYFPEDQKFAIYVPLFLPISLPLFASAFSSARFLWRLYQSRATAAAVHQKTD